MNQTKPLKVLHLTTHLNPGGISKYILDILNKSQDPSIQYYVLSSGGEWSAQCAARCKKIQAISIRTKSILSLKLWLAFPKVIAFVKQNDIQVIHAHTRITQVLASAVCALTKAKLVTTCHGFFKTNLGRKLFPAWGHCVIAISEPVKRGLMETHGIHDKWIQVIPNGIDVKGLEKELSTVDAKKERNKHNIPDNNFVFGITSRVAEGKGHEDLVRAFDVLKKSTPDVSLVIAGDGKLLSGIRKMAAQLECVESIYFIREVESIAKIMSLLDAFVFPVNGPEGFGLAPAEAMIAKLPVILSDRGVLNEAPRDGESALIFKQRDIEGLAAAMRKVAVDASLAQKLARQGYELASKEFDLNRTVTSIESAYKSLI